MEVLKSQAEIEKLLGSKAESLAAIRSEFERKQKEVRQIKCDSVPI